MLQKNVNSNIESFDGYNISKVSKLSGFSRRSTLPKETKSVITAESRDSILILDEPKYKRRDTFLRNRTPVISKVNSKVFEPYANTQVYSLTTDESVISADKPIVPKSKFDRKTTKTAENIFGTLVVDTCLSNYSKTGKNCDMQKNVKKTLMQIKKNGLEITPSIGLKADSFNKPKTTQLNHKLVPMNVCKTNGLRLKNHYEEDATGIKVETVSKILKCERNIGLINNTFSLCGTQGEKKPKKDQLKDTNGNNRYRRFKDPDGDGIINH